MFTFQVLGLPPYTLPAIYTNAYSNLKEIKSSKNIDSEDVFIEIGYIKGPYPIPGNGLENQAILEEALANRKNFVANVQFGMVLGLPVACVLYRNGRICFYPFCIDQN